jgi:hypothetical protein
MRSLINKFSWSTLYQTLGVLGSLLIFILLVKKENIAIVGEYTVIISILTLIFGITDFSSTTYCLRQLSLGDLKYLKIFFLLRLVLIIVGYFSLYILLNISPYTLVIVLLAFVFNFEFISFYLKSFKVICVTRLILLILVVGVVFCRDSEDINTYILCWAALNFLPKMAIIFYQPGWVVLRSLTYIEISIDDVWRRTPILLGAIANSFNSLVVNSGIWVFSGVFLTDSQIGTLSIYMKLKIPFQLANVVLSSYAIPVLSNVRGDKKLFLEQHKSIESMLRSVYFCIFLFIVLGVFIVSSSVEHFVESIDYFLILLCVLINLPVVVSLSSGLFYMFAFGEDALYSRYVFTNGVIVMALLILSSPWQSLYSIPLVLFTAEAILAMQCSIFKRKTYPV